MRSISLPSVQCYWAFLQGFALGKQAVANSLYFKPQSISAGFFTQEDADAARVMGELASIALQKSYYIDDLKEKNQSLKKAMTELRTLRGIIPICMYCKGIRDDNGIWSRLEEYLTEHTDAQLSHGICDKCVEDFYPKKIFVK
ncbi:MAG: hypothetical protein LC645_03730 [Geobacteraceae bacterium]|nr:hypothetical protein [Geobacteraceae bacterium]